MAAPIRDGADRTVRGLAAAGRPLLEIDPRGAQAAPTRQAIALTPFGRDVLAGRADHVAVNGIDRWLGGVHVAGQTPSWRWDEESRGDGSRLTCGGVFRFYSCDPFFIFHSSFYIFFARAHDGV